MVNQNYNLKEVKSFANQAAFPTTGTADVIYIDKANNRPYYWTGTTYAPLSASATAAINVYLQSSSTTKPSPAVESDTLLVEENGVVTEYWIFDGTDWKRIELGSPSYASGSIQAAIKCIGSPMQTFNYTDTKTVGTGGDYSDLVAAMAAPDNTRLLLLNGQQLSATLNVTKPLLIDGQDNVVQSTATDPVNMINFTNGGGIINTQLQHLKTTNTSVESIININSTPKVYVQNNTFEIQEFGVVARGNYVISNNTFSYVGASATNSHRFIVIYGNSGDSRIAYNEFTASNAPTTRYSNFILMGSVSGTTYEGKLYINDNIQNGGELRQFFLHEAGVTTGLELYVANNQFNDLNGGIGILSPTLFNSYSKIGIYNNIQGGDATGNFKGVFFVDGTGALSDTVELTYGGNETAAGTLRADYLSLDTESTNIIAYKDTITATLRTTPTNESIQEDLGLLLQDLKAKKTYIVDSEGTPLKGDGSEENPYELPEISDSGFVTTSLLGQNGTGSSWVAPTLVSETTTVDAMLLSDGNYLHQGRVTWIGHPLTKHAYYFATTTSPYYSSTPPSTGIVQQLFFVVDENTIDIDIEQGINLNAPAFANLVYVNSTDPNTATIFDTNNPPVTNDDTLKQDSANLFITSDGASWVWNGTAYVTKTFASSTEWFLTGTATDATSNKVNPIYRNRGIAVGTALTASNSTGFQSSLYAAYEDFGANKQMFLFRDSRFPLTQPAGFALSNGGGGGDFYPVFSANPRGASVSFILGAGYAPVDDAAGNSTPAMLYRVNRTGANASPLLNRPLFGWQNFTTMMMRMDVSGRLAIGQDMTHTPSAQFQINSTIRGFLPPRMTTAQINAIASPANGLTVYNTDLNKLCVYELNAWKQVTTTAM